MFEEIRDLLVQRGAFEDLEKLLTERGLRRAGARLRRDQVRARRALRDHGRPQSYDRAALQQSIARTLRARKEPSSLREAYALLQEVEVDFPDLVREDLKALAEASRSQRHGAGRAGRRRRDRRARREGTRSQAARARRRRQRTSASTPSAVRQARGGLGLRRRVAHGELQLAAEARPCDRRPAPERHRHARPAALEPTRDDRAGARARAEGQRPGAHRALRRDSRRSRSASSSSSSGSRTPVA